MLWNRQKIAMAVQIFGAGVILWVLSGVLAWLLAFLAAHWWAKGVEYSGYPLYLSPAFPVIIALAAGGFAAPFVSTLRHRGYGLIWGLIFGVMSAGICQILYKAEIFFFPFPWDVVLVGLLLVAGVVGGLLGQILSAKVGGALEMEPRINRLSKFEERLGEVETRLSEIESWEAPPEQEPEDSLAARLLRLEERLSEMELIIKSKAGGPAGGGVAPGREDVPDKPPEDLDEGGWS